jgi:hypothetical protein
MKLKFRILLILSVVFIASCGNKGEKILLRFKPVVGETQNLYMKMSVDMGKMMGVSAGEMKMEMDATMMAKNIDANGNVEMEMEYKRVLMSLSSIAQNFSYDSEKDVIDMADPTSLAFLPMYSMLNKKVSFTMDQRAKMVSPPDMTALMSDSLMTLLGDKAKDLESNKMMENMFAIFPEEEVYVGYSWDAESKVTLSQGPMAVKYNYTVKSISADDVVLDVTGTLDGEVNQQGISAKMKGTITGTITFNRATGMTKASELVQDISMTMMGMNVDVKNTISITTSK